MNDQILNFLTNHRVGAVSILLPDGTPHNSALHFSHIENPFTLFFSTESTSRKCQGLLKGEIVKASVVIGLSEEEWITLQMDGVVRGIFDPTELKYAHTVHYKKHPGSEQYKNDPTTMFLAFSPTWWRYTDYNTDPDTIITSE